jgi:hypothetical protein
MTFITDIEKSTLKFIWKHKRLLIDKVMLRKKSKMLEVSKYRTSNFKLCYRTVAIKPAWYWHKNRYENQWNKIEELDMNLPSYTQLNFDKVAKNI